MTPSSLPRLSGAEQIILDLLVQHGELFGLALVEASDGRLKRGTVYVTLGRMEAKGYLDSRQESLPPGATGLPRRLYTPTAYALRVRDAWRMAARVMAGDTIPEAG